MRTASRSHSDAGIGVVGCRSLTTLAAWWVSSRQTVEYARLCDLLDEHGPKAPTLLDPWTTLDLAAHLVVREYDSPCS